MFPAPRVEGTHPTWLCVPRDGGDGMGRLARWCPQCTVPGRPAAPAWNWLLWAEAAADTWARCEWQPGCEKASAVCASPCGNSELLRGSSSGFLRGGVLGRPDGMVLWPEITKIYRQSFGDGATSRCPMNNADIFGCTVCARSLGCYLRGTCPLSCLLEDKPELSGQEHVPNYTSSPPQFPVTPTTQRSTLLSGLR